MYKYIKPQDSLFHELNNTNVNHPSALNIMICAKMISNVLRIV